MNGYLLSVIGTVLLCAILTAILPEGKTAGAIKGVAKLACVLAIVAPVLEFFKSGKKGESEQKTSSGIFSETVIQTDEAFIEYYSELRIRETETALESELNEKFQVQAKITLEWQREKETVDGKYESDSIRITRIRIWINDETEEVSQMIAEYVKKNYCSEVLLE